MIPARRGGPGRPPKPAYPGPPANLRQLAIAHADQIQLVTWQQGTRATKGNPTASMTSHFLAIRVRPANRDIPRADDSSLPECWLLAEWPPEADEPAGYWLSDLPQDTPIAELARLAKIRWRIGHATLALGRRWPCSVGKGRCPRAHGVARYLLPPGACRGRVSYLAAPGFLAAEVMIGVRCWRELTLDTPERFTQRTRGRSR